MSGWYGRAAPEDRAWWKRTRRRLLRIRGEQCQRCPRRDNLALHHLHPVGEGGKVRARDSDLIVLCPRCHRREHADPETRRWIDFLASEWG